MEQSRRRGILALAVLALLAAAGASWALLQRRPVSPVRSTPAALAGNERILVEVLNASSHRGRARVATRELRAAGFDVVYFGNTSDARARTEVLSRRGDSTAAVRVARALGAGSVRVATDTLLRVDVTVLLGEDYRPPPGIRP